MGWMVPPITMGVLEQNFTPDALPDTTPVSQRKLETQFVAGDIALAQAPARKAARTISQTMFKATMVSCAELSSG